MNLIINGQDSYELNIQSILVPNSIDTSVWSENHFAIVSISLADFEDFKNYDFRNEYENYFSFIKCIVYFIDYVIINVFNFIYRQ